MDATVSIERQEIDVSPIAGPDLSCDDEQVDAAYARVLIEHLLKALFEFKWQRFQLTWPAIGHSPDRHFNSQ